ncbi:MAG: RCC1-like domain-containing protein [bacterium]
MGLSGIFGDASFFAEPQICSFGIVIKLLACGARHTLFASEGGRCVYAMGSN